MPKTVPWDKGVKIIAHQTEARAIVPTAHVFTWRRQTGNLPKDFEQAIIVEVKKAGMVLLELPPHGTIEQLHLGIGKSREWSVDYDGALIPVGPSGNYARRVRGSSASGGGLEKGSAADEGVHAVSPAR